MKAKISKPHWWVLYSPTKKEWTFRKKKKRECTFKHQRKQENSAKLEKCVGLKPFTCGGFFGT
jgi:hypothetical protein